MSFRMGFDLAAIEGVVERLGDDFEAAARPAAQAAAQVLYDEVKRNVGRLGMVSGNLNRAIYQVFSQKNSGPGVASYQISWNHRKAPHGHLLEFGHIARYATYVGRDGLWHTAVRPEMRGKAKPGRRASQAVKDAYYMPRPGGPVQIAAQAFVRSAAGKFPQAVAAAKAELIRRVNYDR